MLSGLAIKNFFLIALASFFLLTISVSPLLAETTNRYHLSEESRNFLMILPQESKDRIDMATLLHQLPPHKQNIFLQKYRMLDVVSNADKLEIDQAQFFTSAFELWQNLQKDLKHHRNKDSMRNDLFIIFHHKQKEYRANPEIVDEAMERIFRRLHDHFAHAQQDKQLLEGMAETLNENLQQKTKGKTGKRIIKESALSMMLKIYPHLPRPLLKKHLAKMENKLQKKLDISLAKELKPREDGDDLLSTVDHLAFLLVYLSSKVDDKKLNSIVRKVSRYAHKVMPLQTNVLLILTENDCKIEGANKKQLVRDNLKKKFILLKKALREQIRHHKVQTTVMTVHLTMMAMAIIMLVLHIIVTITAIQVMIFIGIVLSILALVSVNVFMFCLIQGILIIISLFAGIGTISPILLLVAAV